MEPLFEGLTESEVQYLQYLHERGYFDGFEMFLNTDTSSNYRFDKFVSNGYITNDGHEEKSGSYKITVTGKGIAAIVDYERYKKQIQPLSSQVEVLKQIAESTETIAQSTAIQSRLTNDAKTILYKLYKEYLDKRKHGFSKPISKNFGSFEEIHANFFPQLLSEDLDNFLHELMDTGFLNDISANETIQKFELSNHAISTLEFLPKDALRSAGKFIAYFISR